MDVAYEKAAEPEVGQVVVYYQLKPYWDALSSRVPPCMGGWGEVTKHRGIKYVRPRTGRPGSKGWSSTCALAKWVRVDEFNMWFVIDE